MWVREMGEGEGCRCVHVRRISQSAKGLVLTEEVEQEADNAEAESGDAGVVGAVDTAL